MRILFVDDEDLILRATKRAFKNEGYELFFARDVAEAIAVVESHAIDVVVTDHRMPGATGVELLAWLRAHRPHIVRLLASGYVEEAALPAVLEARVHKIIEKPWEPDDMRRTMRHVATAFPPRVDHAS